MSTTTAAAPAHEDLLEALVDFIDEEHRVIADLGYEGENDKLVC